MKQEFVQYIKKHKLFEPGAHIIVGVSGGADSLCLLHLLCKIQTEWNLTLSIVHVNHGIRGKEAEEDANYVAQLADEWNLPFFLIHEDVKTLAKQKGKTEEEAGRDLRYDEFERIRKEQGADWIAVAHHQDDQAETILFQMLRGSSVRGIMGMPPKRGNIIRPLLNMNRRQIENYLAQENITYRQDYTNEDTKYARNYIRKELLPQLEQNLNSQAARHITEMASDAREWLTYIEKQAKPVAKELISENEAGEIVLDIPALMQQEKVICDEVLRMYFEKGICGAKDITRKHYEQVRELWEKETGKKICLPNQMIAERRYDRLYLYSDNKETLQSDVLNSKFPMQNLECGIPSVNIVNRNEEDIRITFTLVNRKDLPQEIPEKDYTKWFDYDKIRDDLSLRNPREGDFIILDKSGHRKKLNRYFIDQKIPASQRKEQLVLAEGSNVLWVIPGRIGADYKITESTTKVLVVTKERVCYERGNQSID